MSKRKFQLGDTVRPTRYIYSGQHPYHSAATSQKGVVVGYDQGSPRPYTIRFQDFRNEPYNIVCRSQFLRKIETKYFLVSKDTYDIDEAVAAATKVAASLHQPVEIKNAQLAAR